MFKSFLSISSSHEGNEVFLQNKQHFLRPKCINLGNIHRKKGKIAIICKSFTSEKVPDKNRSFLMDL